MLLPDEIFNMILLNLPLKDYYMFMFVSYKLYTNKIKSYIDDWKIQFKLTYLNKCNNNVLNQIDIIYNLGFDIKRFLKDKKAFIAGGFPLSYINNDLPHNKHNDIDIFITSYTKEELSNLTNYDEYIKKYIINVPNHSVYDFNTTIEHINDIHVVDCISDIQFIYIKPAHFKDIQTYINTTFDLSCCRCWFDGDKLDCSIDDFYNMIQGVAYIDHEQFKKSWDNWDDYIHYFKDRIEKYEKKGFVIRDVNEDAKFNVQFIKNYYNKV